MWLSFLWVKQQWWPQLLSSPVNPAPVPGISRLKYSGGALRLRLNRKVLTALWQPKRDSHIIILLFVVLPWVLLKWTSPNQNPLAFQRSSSTSRLVLVVVHPSLPCLEEEVYPFPVFLFPFRTNVSICFSSSYRRPTLVCTLTPVPLSEHRDGRTADDEDISESDKWRWNAIKLPACFSLPTPGWKRMSYVVVLPLWASSSFHHMYWDR